MISISIMIINVNSYWAAIDIYGEAGVSSKPRSEDSPYGVFLVARRGFPEPRTELKFVQFCMELPYKN